MPGIQPGDVQELIDRGAKAVVLSRGVWNCPETLELLAKDGIAVEVLQTEAAVARFNELREIVAAGGLFHHLIVSSDGVRSELKRGGGGARPFLDLPQSC